MRTSGNIKHFGVARVPKTGLLVVMKQRSPTIEFDSFYIILGIVAIRRQNTIAMYITKDCKEWERP